MDWSKWRHWLPPAFLPSFSSPIPYLKKIRPWWPHGLLLWITTLYFSCWKLTNKLSFIDASNLYCPISTCHTLSFSANDKETIRMPQPHRIARRYNGFWFASLSSATHFSDMFFSRCCGTRRRVNVTDLSKQCMCITEVIRKMSKFDSFFRLMDKSGFQLVGLGCASRYHLLFCLAYAIHISHPLLCFTFKIF